MKKLSDTVGIFAVASVLSGIPAVVEAVQPGGTNRVGSAGDWTDYFFSQLPADKPQVIYDDHAHELWNKLNQIDSHTIKYVDRFYGQDIIITVDPKPIANGEEPQVNASGSYTKGYSCATPNPTLFWELVLIRSKGDSVICELNN